VVFSRGRRNSVAGEMVGLSRLRLMVVFGESSGVASGVVVFGASSGHFECSWVLRGQYGMAGKDEAVKSNMSDARM
jgi:hypothetical protein